jgi:hypothetical protein
VVLIHQPAQISQPRLTITIVQRATSGHFFDVRFWVEVIGIKRFTAKATG